MRSGPAVYFDGSVARRREVVVALEPGALRISENGGEIGLWNAELVRREDGPRGLLRMGLATGSLARLEVSEPDLIGAIERHCTHLDDPHHAGRGKAGRIVALSLAAAASIVLTAVYLVPVAAERLVFLVPASLEKKIGDAVDNRIRALLGTKVCSAPAGKAALSKLSSELARAARLEAQPTVEVLPVPQVNAIALPGGRIYVFEELLKRASEPDEIAGVLAHEMGHVANRDGLKKLFQVGGTSYLLGLLFGDVAGAGVIVLFAQLAIDSSYSREIETGADRFAGEVVASLGRPSTPMAALLDRISSGGILPEVFQSHPVTEGRVAMLKSISGSATGAPLLSEPEWKDLLEICR